MTKLEALQSDYELQIARLKDDRNELKAELAALRAERDRLVEATEALTHQWRVVSEERDRLREFADDVRLWSEAYPTNIFTEPTPEQVDAVCKTLGFRIDRISAMVL